MQICDVFVAVAVVGAKAPYWLVSLALKSSYGELSVKYVMYCIVLFVTAYKKRFWDNTKSVYFAGKKHVVRQQNRDRLVL